MKVYNSFSILGLFISILLSVLFLFILHYIIAIIEYRTFAVSVIATFCSVFNLLNVSIVMIFLFIFPKIQGYAVSDEGIGTVKATKTGWQYIAYVKWKDITVIEYKRTVLSLGAKVLLIHSNTYTYKRKKYLGVASNQREFKEIVNTVTKKTNLPLDKPNHQPN